MLLSSACSLAVFPSYRDSFGITVPVHHPPLAILVWPLLTLSRWSHSICYHLSASCYDLEVADCSRWQDCYGEAFGRKGCWEVLGQWGTSQKGLWKPKLSGFLFFSVNPVLLASWCHLPWYPQQSKYHIALNNWYSCGQPTWMARHVLPDPYYHWPLISN